MKFALQREKKKKMHMTLSTIKLAEKK